MPHIKPLGMIRDEIELICRALEFYGTHAALLPLESNHLPDLRRKLETEVPFFPCYLLAWPGVTAEEMAPVLSDESAMPETPADVYELTMLQGAALSMFTHLARDGDPLLWTIARRDFEGHIRSRSTLNESEAAGFVDDLLADNLVSDARTAGSLPAVQLSGRGLAALDAWKGRRKGEATLSGGEESREGSGIVRKERPPQSYGEPGPVRECPVCRGSGDCGNAAIGYRECRECKGTGRVLTISPAHVADFLEGARDDFRDGHGARAFATVVNIVAHLAARIESAEATANGAANLGSMLANGVQPD